MQKIQDYLEGLNGQTSFLLFLFNGFNELCHELISDIVDVPPSFCGCDTVDKRDLSESRLAHGEGDFPAIVHLFVNNLQWLVVVVGFVFDVKINVILEVFHLATKINIH